MRRELDRTISRFDAVHIHELWHYPNYAAAGAALHSDVPYIISPLGGFAPTAVSKSRLKKWLFNSLVARRLPRRATSFHAMTAREGDDTAAHVSGVPIDVIPLGIDPTRFASLPAPGEFDRSYPGLEGKRVAVFLGRLSRIKGLDILIDGFARAARGRDDLHLVIAGPDEGYEGAARQMVAAASLDSKVSFIGPVYDEIKLAALSRADVFVLTSYGEGFSVAVLEALAASLPVIISTECHFPAVAEAGAGREINLDAGEFGTTLTSLLDDPAELKKMSANARAMATGPYSWDTIGLAFREIYQRVKRD